jgi:hypothetical protein
LTISHLRHLSPHAPLGHSHSAPRARTLRLNSLGKRRPKSQAQKHLLYPHYLHHKHMHFRKVLNGLTVLSASAQ